jgi:hypothetical protein
MNRPRTGWGVLLLTVGVLLLLDRAGALDAARVLGRGWPVLLIVAGLVRALRRPRDVPGGAILAGVGGLLLAWTTGVPIDLGLLVALGLVAGGAALLLRRPRPPATFGTDPTVVVLGDRQVRAPAGPLETQRVVTVFGDTDLDLTEATLEGEATLGCTTVFGDLDIEVPAHWRVEVHGPTVLGDVRVPVGAGPGAPVLHLETVTVLGDLEVRARAVPVAPVAPVAPGGPVRG